MKIYNEIVIDMNPESSSYGETLHEDSYEYEGDVTLLNSHWRYSYQGSNNIMNSGQYYIWDASYGQYKMVDINAQSWDDDQGKNVNTYDSSDFTTIAELTEDVTLGPQGGQQFDFTQTEGEFDPTSSEFKEYVGTTGSFDLLAEGYGEEAIDFDEFYGAPLDYAKQQYGTGKQALGLQTGSSLGDIYGQTEQFQQASGLESSGKIKFKQREATKGVMGDYLTQQKELSNTLSMKTADFWKTTEDQFYAELEENQAGK